MKVLISRKDLRDTTSGVPKKVLQELRFFSSKGYEAYAIAETMNSEMVKEFNGIPVKTWQWPISGYFRRKFYQKRVQSWIQKNKPEIVIGHGDILDQDVLFIHNCVHLAHELVEGKALPKDHEVGRIHEEILTKGQFKVLVCNSQMMKDDLVKRFKVPENKAVVIYPEVNLQKFTTEAPEETRKVWRNKFGFTDSDFVFGIVTSGNFKKRNLGMLIDAFAELSKTDDSARLFIAGGNLSESYLQQIRNLGIESKVRTAEPILDVKNYYYLIDTFVLPAHIEEFGRSVLEAMYCGKPAITTSKVGASEIFEGESRGLILDSITKENLIQKLRMSKDTKRFISTDVALKYSADLQNEKFEQTLRRYKVI